ncbi:hypothetical protein [Kocuria sp. U4B]
MGTDHQPTTAARAASTVDPLARAAAFTALRPALEALTTAAGADARLSAETCGVLRAVTNTGPEDTLALADLAARASTPKARIPHALSELAAHGYLARLTAIAPHLAAALPATTPPPAAPTRQGAGPPAADTGGRSAHDR